MATAKTKKTFPLKRFAEWLAVRSQGKTLKAREDELRIGSDPDVYGGMLGMVMELGEQDDKGSYFVDLAKPYEFQDEKGNVVVYTGIKAQRSLKPSRPTPDPELAETLLRKKGLWLNDGQMEMINQLRLAARFVRIEIEVDTEMVAQAYTDKILSADEYDSILMEQTENFAFVPLQDK